MTTFLPYYCPTFKTDHLLEPCKTNLARVKALKAAKKHIGPLEKCLECKGKMLIKKSRVEIEGLPAPESWVEKRFVDELICSGTQNPPKPYHQNWDPNPEVTTAPHPPEKAAIAPEFAICSPVDPLHPPFISESAPVSEEAWHELGKEPEMRQLSAHQRFFQGAAVQRLGKKPPKKEEIAPELPKKQEEIVPAVKIAEKEADELVPGMVIFYKPGDDNDPALKIPMEPRYCPTHPEVLQRMDKLGRWMGMCDECLSIRGKKCGVQNIERGITAPPMSIPLNLPKYAELKEWLAVQAEENERSLTQQIMFILKTAWRQGI